MARADNSTFLAQANAARQRAALAAARHAIEQLQREGRVAAASSRCPWTACPLLRIRSCRQQN